MNWLELIITTQCNCRCQVCDARSATAQGDMSPESMAHWLQWGREQGASGVWFGGGEPTLHPCLLEAISLARTLGYTHRKIQTNGLRLAYPEFTAQCLQAGATQVAVSVLGSDPESHDLMTQRPGSYALLQESLQQAQHQGLWIHADVLISKISLSQLPAMVADLHGRGVRSLWFWLAHTIADRLGAIQVPAMAEVALPLAEALETADRLGLPARSLHTPPCVLPRGLRRSYLASGNLDLWVVAEGQNPFPAQESPMEGGQFLPGCTNCRARGQCQGIRQDQLSRFGGEPYQALGGLD